MSDCLTACLSNEHVFRTTPDGAVWTDGPFAASFWEKYLDFFDRVVVLARLQPVTGAPAGWERSDRAGVAFAAVPPYRGVTGALRAVGSISSAARAAHQGCNVMLVRTPGTIGSLVAVVNAVRRRPYALEVVSDPWAALAPGVTGKPGATLCRPLVALALRYACRRATGVAYVTSEALQRRYPPGRRTVVGRFAAAELRPEAYLPSRHEPPAPPWRLVAVGSMATRYKGVDDLLDALRALLQSGIDARLTVVGGGSLLPRYVEYAQALGLGHAVDFAGPVPSGRGVREHLVRSHLFVHASWTEGLPSAVLEAMASGLPCIATSVGGVGELLPTEALVPPHDPLALAAAMGRMLTDDRWRCEMAQANFETSLQYREDILRERRHEFFTAVCGRLGLSLRP